MSVTITKATPLDHGNILTLLLEWLEEATIKSFPGLCNYTGIWISDLIARHLVYIAKIGEKLVGCIGLKFGHLPWNNEVPIIFNEFLMTDKAYRGKGIADKLIEACKDFAKQHKIMLMVGHFTGTKPELKDRYLRIHGFTYAGGNFVYKGE